MKKLQESLKTFLVPFSFLKGCLSISKKYVSLTLLIALTKTIQPVLSVWLTKRVLDELLGAGGKTSLMFLVLLLIGSNFLIAFLRAFFTSQNAVLEETFKDDFRKLVGRKIMSVGFDSLEDPKTVDLQEKALRPILNYGVLNQLLSQPF